MNSHDEHEPLLNEDEIGDQPPPKRISKLNKILLAVIIGLIILLSVSVGLFAGAEVNYKKAQNAKETITVTQSYTPKPTQSPGYNLCTTQSCVNAASEIMDSIDDSVDPCDSFYEYANGGWLETHPIPPSKGVRSIFEDVGNKNTEIVKSIILANVGTEEYSPADKANMRTIKTLYDSCTNTKAQDKKGAEPLLHLTDELISIFNKRYINQKESRQSILTQAAAYLQSKNIGALFSFSLDGDVGKDPSKQVMWLSQDDALSLPDKDYYEDEKNVKFIAEITQEILKAVHERKDSKHHKIPKNSYRKLSREIARFEQYLARISWNQVDSANPIKTYNPKNLTELSETAPYIDWPQYFALLNHNSEVVEPVIVQNPGYFEALDNVLSVDEKTLEGYFILKLVLNLGSTLSPKTHIGKTVNRFNALISGTNPKAEKDIELDCLEAVVDQVGFLAGRPFVLEAFPGESKSKFENIVDGIIDSFIHRLPNLGWLDDKTVKAATNKANVIHKNKKIGYPTSHPNTLDPEDLANYYSINNILEDDWFGNTLRSQEAEAVRMFNKAGKKAEGEWDMIPTEVNAYYQPSKNEIVFPAGILQPPFFKADWPQVLNYGSAGSVAAHELCHAFDHVGRQYEADGRLIFDGSWWSNETVQAFIERAECIVNQYNNFTMPGPRGQELNVNGRFVVGEAIGDLGLVQAYNAWKNAEAEEKSLRLPGVDFTDEQLFFISFARGWARSTRLEENLKRIKTDPHAPPKWRVDGTLRNTPEFAKAFGCKKGSLMNPPDSEQCRMW
ncbi:zincin [Wallemia mellicola CBS 633.66]|uniref:Zincin n=1 Tax=Wallemia mellicola (strain ATCC MYA-4683 / CBS 633.66) TaxID=671144 RepID=I4YA35_WALMC|nr:zincin [Wallemia mellicola CBS 633.66]EIM20827.1 zincin [Wallemia mellicola CBS 633.66]|eukprot:XP_006959089.1 zincin [Wallemia mellicola CBS 633.66]